MSHDPSAWLKVDRVGLNLAADHEGAQPSLGFLGYVRHLPEFEREIAQRWGGGTYSCSSAMRSKTVEIPGESR